MKLYATTTSERATKGQGGNRFLEIEITSEDTKNKHGELKIRIFPDITNNYILEINEGANYGNLIFKKKLSVKCLDIHNIWKIKR